MEEHKVFKIRELSDNIIKQIDTHTIAKRSHRGQIYYTKETQNVIYRKITNTCKLWWMTYRNEALHMEYYEGSVFNVYFCSICGRYETNIYENTRRHQNKQLFDLDTGQQKAEFERTNETISWDCNKGCVTHCIAEPGHCQRGQIAEYRMLQAEEYKSWRQLQINKMGVRMTMKVKEAMEEMYKKDRNVSRRLKIIKGKNGKDKTINLSIKL
jgi:hypothetical protein